MAIQKTAFAAALLGLGLAGLGQVPPATQPTPPTARQSPIALALWPQALEKPDLQYQLLPRMVWRGGYGVYYQHENRIGSEAILQLNPPQFIDTVEATGANSAVFQLQDGFPAAIVNSTSFSLPNLQIRAQDPNQRTSYVEQTSFGFEYQVAGDMVASATYVGNWGRKMNRLRDYNMPTVTGFDGGCPIIQYPYANLNSVTTIDTFAPAGCTTTGAHAYLETATNDGNSDYNAIEVQLRRTMSKSLSFSLGYTYAHAMSNYSDNLTSTPLPQNSYDYAAEMGNSPFDVRSRFVGNFIWELPFGQGRRQACARQRCCQRQGRQQP